MNRDDWTPERTLLHGQILCLQSDIKKQGKLDPPFLTAMLSASMSWDVLRALKAALGTLDALGYTYHGGELFKPPLGPASVLHAEGVLEDLVQEVRKTVQDVWAGVDVVRAKEANDAAEFFKNELMRLVRERHRAS